jgi:hypothetical protein
MCHALCNQAHLVSTRTETFPVRGRALRDTAFSILLLIDMLFLLCFIMYYIVI